jgi:hypothetical protein
MIGAFLRGRKQGMEVMKNRPWIVICSGIALLGAALACSFSPLEDTSSGDATAAALRTSIAANATQAAGIESTTQAEQAQPPATQPVSTVQPSQATEPAVETGPTQTALAPIRGELSLYGLDPEQGELGWIHPPLTMEVDEYRGSKFDTAFPLTVASDFVLASDITWDTEYGGSGCAFVFRSDGNEDQPSQYIVAASRISNGRVFFAVMSQGELVVGKDFYANGIDPKFDASNGATNHLAVVGQGSTFTIYSNGTRLGEVDPNDPLPPLALPDPPLRPLLMADPAVAAAYRQSLAEYQRLVNRLKQEYNQRLKLWNELDKDFERGFVALGVVAESGRTQCEFNNAWLWLLEEQ